MRTKEVSIIWIYNLVHVHINSYVILLAFLSAAPDLNCTATADAVDLKLTDHSMASIGFVMCDNLS